MVLRHLLRNCSTIVHENRHLYALQLQELPTRSSMAPSSSPWLLRKFGTCQARLSLSISTQTRPTLRTLYMQLHTLRIRLTRLRRFLRIRRVVSYRLRIHLESSSAQLTSFAATFEPDRPPRECSLEPVGRLAGRPLRECFFEPRRHARTSPTAPRV